LLTSVLKHLILPLLIECTEVVITLLLLSLLLFLLFIYILTG